VWKIKGRSPTPRTCSQHPLHEHLGQEPGNPSAVTHRKWGHLKPAKGAHTYCELLSWEQRFSNLSPQSAASSSPFTAKFPFFLPWHKSVQWHRVTCGHRIRVQSILPGVFSSSPVRSVHSAVCENASDLSLWAKNKKMQVWNARWFPTSLANFNILSIHLNILK
jgi:hypothetical protein